MSYLGTNKIGKMYLGTTEIAKAYLGTSLVFQNEEPLERIGNWSKQLVLNPSSYDTNDYSYYGLSGASNAYNSITNTESYASINLTRGQSAYTYIYFKFDTSAIPANATIDSIDCIARLYMTNTGSANISSRGGKMCSGTTEKTDPITISTTATDSTFTMGSWTRSKLNDIRLKLYATRGSSRTTTSYYIRLYGADLTIDYTYETTIYKVKVVNDVSGLVVSPETQEYASGDNATVTFSGLASGFSVTDNGNDVTNQLVSSGGNLVYNINNISAGHKIIVKSN